MPSMNKVVFGDKVFNTKKHAEEYVRSLIYGIGICDRVKQCNPKLFYSLCDVLKCHPSHETKLENMVDLRIVQNVLNKRALEVRVVKSDFSTEDISWRMCVTGRENSHKNELKSAMRYSIDDQIHNFKNAQGILVCALCNCVDKCMHADHIVHFEKLVYDFINTTMHPVPSTFCDASDDSNRRAFKYSDIQFEKSWQAYHKKHAQLRILCERCNLSRKKYKFCP